MAAWITLWWLPEVETDVVDEVLDDVGDKWWWPPTLLPWYRFWLRSEWAWNWDAVGEDGTLLAEFCELRAIAAAATATAAEFRMFDEDVEL